MFFFFFLPKIKFTSFIFHPKTKTLFVYSSVLIINIDNNV